MPKLLNGRPMSERPNTNEMVLFLSSSGQIFIHPANSYPKSAIEWAEIFKPEPKPDANGWFKLSVDCKPELLQNVMLLKDNNLVWRTWQGEPSLFAYDYWKPFIGPVEAT